MSHDDIDLDRVIIDPAYRREVIDFLKAAERSAAEAAARAVAPPEPRRAD